jgi:hypothetical protein
MYCESWYCILQLTQRVLKCVYCNALWTGGGSWGFWAAVTCSIIRVSDSACSSGGHDPSSQLLTWSDLVRAAGSE